MKPEVLLLVAVLLIVAVALYAAFNPQVEKEKKGNEKEKGKEFEREISNTQATQEALASEIEKQNTQLKKDEALAKNPYLEPESAVNENPIKIQAK